MKSLDSPARKPISNCLLVLAAFLVVAQPNQAAHAADNSVDQGTVVGETITMEPYEVLAASAEFKRWIKVCMKHLVSDDPMVKRSAGLALRSMGAAARPALEKAAKGEDETLAAAAKQILEGGRGGREGRNPEGGGRGGRGGNMNQRLAERLELTEEQKPKFEAIMEDATTKRRALMQSMRNEEIDREAAMEQMREIQEAATASLAEVLTEEQMTRYRDMMERMRGRRGGGR